MSDHPISVEMLEAGHLLLLGTTGAGKTYQQRGFLERLRRADRRVGAVDKLGNHWGLTMSADGQRPGLDFVIFGGKRAHVPMRPHQGGELGRLFVERNVPAIFDVSQWHGDEQQMWMEDFADAVFMHNEGALHLGLDEAQSWVPQGGGGDCFRAVQRLAEQGRGNGIFLMLACQRWSRLDSSVRGMTDSLIVAMRQTSPIDRKAVTDMIATSRGQAKEIDEQLPLLKNGEGYVWEPRAARVERYQFPENTTFDSSRTPRHGDTAPAPVAVSNELVAELRALLAPPAEAGKAESQNSGYPDDSIPADPIEALAKGSAVGEMLWERDKHIAALELRLADIPALKQEIETAITTFGYALDQMKRGVTAAFEAYFPVATADTKRLDDLGSVQDGRQMSTDGPHSASGKRAPRTSEKADVTAGETAPHPMAAKIVARLQDMAPARFTWRQVASIMGYSPDGGFFRAGKRGAIASGELIEEGDYIRAKGQGRPLSRVEALQLWSDVLPAPAAAILEALGNAATTKAHLAGLLGYAPTGGHFRKGLAHLRQNGVIIESGDTVHIAATIPGEHQ